MSISTIIKKNYRLSLTFIMSLFILFTHTGCSMLGFNRVEEVSYQVIVKENNKEIRKYPARIIAKASTEGNYKEAQNKAFRILADYIFGNNSSRTDIPMTSPVLQKPDQNTGQKIEMTSPVTQQENTSSRWTLAFTMPAKFKTIEDLPKPNNPNVLLEKLPQSYFAAIGYSWYGSIEKNNKKSQELLSWLNKDSKVKVISKPFYAGYNPPWTIPFFRRNEMLVEIFLNKKEK